MEHLWYYGSFLEVCRDFSDHPAYQEYARLFREIKARVIEYRDHGSHGSHLQVVAVPGSEKWVLRDDLTGDIYALTSGEFEELLAQNEKGAEA